MLITAEKYLNPLTDFGFKKLFGSAPNKDLLIDLLNQIIPDRQIADLNYSSNEHLGKFQSDRKAIFDIYCIGENGERFIVEMQKAKQNFFKDRSVFYTSFPIQEQAQKKGWNYQLETVYSISILDFMFNERRSKQELFHIVELKDQHCEVFYDKLKFIYIELPKFKKESSELKSQLDKWLYVLRYLWKLDSRPQVLKELVFEKLFEVAEVSKFSVGERAAYEESLKVYRDLNNVVDTARGEAEEKGRKKGLKEGIKKGRKEGIEKGRKQGLEEGIEKGKAEGLKKGKIEVARALKRQGTSNEVIVQLTGLSISEIEAFDT